MGLFDRFTSAGSQPQQQQPQQQQGPQNGPGSSMQQNNPGAGAGTGAPGTPPTAPSNPLDNFKDLWKNPDTSGQPPADPFSQPLFNTDPTKIVEASQKANFLSQIPQELMQKAMSGQDPQAFMEVINSVGQQSLALALQLSTATIEQAGSKIGERYKQDVPNRFKDVQLNSIKSSNPVLSHPSAEPMLQMLRGQIRKNEPNLSADEINRKAEEFLTTFAGQLSPGSQGEGNSGPNSKEGTDWSTWLN